MWTVAFQELVPSEQRPATVQLVPLCVFLVKLHEEAPARARLGSSTIGIAALRSRPLGQVFGHQVPRNGSGAGSASGGSTAVWRAARVAGVGARGGAATATLRRGSAGRDSAEGGSGITAAG